MRFIDSIKGLSDVFETDIPKNSIVLPLRCFMWVNRNVYEYFIAN